jgi:hypothetical protein
MDTVYHRIDSVVSTFGICTNMQVEYIDAASNKMISFVKNMHLSTKIIVYIHKKYRKESHMFINFGRFEDDKPLPPVYKVSQDKAKSLGISFTPLEVTLGDTIESLKEKGFLTV